MAVRAQQTLRALGGSEREVLLIGLAAQLHDIGKVGVPDSILHKPSSLSESEWAIMKKHPDVGAEIVSRVKGLDDVAHVVAAHQEKFDGSGYPRGLRGEQIPLAARIIKVVDAYGAMTEDRVYRKALGDQKAVQELKECKDKDFDPHVVDAFLRVLSSEN
jgi:HD-GYP domain-containing protein (c-di-GMP phosphodiesterase class II)